MLLLPILGLGSGRLIWKRKALDLGIDFLNSIQRKRTPQRIPRLHREMSDPNFFKPLLRGGSLSPESYNHHEWCVDQPLPQHITKRDGRSVFRRLHRDG